MSYRKKHVKNKIGRINPKKSIFTRLWFWLVILFFIIILSGLYTVIFYSGLQIKDIIISGNERVSAQELRDFVYENSNTGLIKFWKININSRSILLVDTNKLDKEILKKFPLIEKLQIDKSYPQTLVLGVTERKPLGIFCSADNQCSLVDQNGIAYEPVFVIPENATVIRQALNNSQVFTGEEVVAQNMIDAIYKIQKSLKDNFQIDLKEALVTSPIRLNVKTGENWQIYFDLDNDSDINSQLTKLNLLLSGEISQDSRQSLRYIDLRPKDRAIICDNSTCGG